MTDGQSMKLITLATYKVSVTFCDYVTSMFVIKPTGCLNAKPDVLNTYKAIKNALLSHKNGICTFMRCGNLSYDPWIWLKILSLSSTASVLNDGRISL